MNMKSVLRQITPPVLWEMGKTVRNAVLPQPEAVPPEITALKAGFDRENRGLGEDVVRIRPGLDLRMHPESKHGFEHFCFRAVDMVKEMDHFLEASRPCRRLLDIGAYHGIFSLVFTKNQPEKRAIAVDASPLAFARLLYNVHKNPDCAITPVELAVSDRAGVLDMHYEWEQVVPGGKVDHDKILHVPMMTADSLCEEQKYSPDIVKVDVEGNEVKVLRGLKHTMRRCRPIMFLEIHPAMIAGQGDSLSALVDYFSLLEYEAHLVSGTQIALSEITQMTDIERVMLNPS